MCLFACGVLFVFAFLLTSPYVLLDYPNAVKGIVREIQHYSTGHLGVTGNSLLWYLSYTWSVNPAYLLLGGNDPKVAAYASTVTWDTMDEYERHIKECADEGFFAFKLHASGDPKWDAELSRNLRRWVGDDADLMFDCSRSAANSLNGAIGMGILRGQEFNDLCFGCHKLLLWNISGELRILGKDSQPHQSLVTFLRS